jgi:hypothetical protein
MTKHYTWLVLLLTLTGCVVPPGLKYPCTMQVSGRAVSGKRAVEGARVYFVDSKDRPLAKPVGSTGADGRFHFDRTYSRTIAGFVWGGPCVGGGGVWRTRESGDKLRIEHPVYGRKAIDLTEVWSSYTATTENPTGESIDEFHFQLGDVNLHR